MIKPADGASQAADGNKTRKVILRQPSYVSLVAAELDMLTHESWREKGERG